MGKELDIKNEIEVLSKQMAEALSNIEYFQKIYDNLEKRIEKLNEELKNL